MKRLLLAVLMIMAVAVGVQAQNEASPSVVRPYHGDGYTEEIITCGDTAGGTAITATTHTPTTPYFGGVGRKTSSSCLVVCETSAIRLSYNGVTPVQNATITTARGIPLDAGQSYRVEGQANVRRIKCINKTNGSAGYARVICDF